MRFIYGQLFWLVPLLFAAVIALAAAAGRRRKRALRSLLGADCDNPDAVRLSPALRRLRIALLLGIAFFLIAAAARPFWNTATRPYESSGRDVMVLFDVSKSMLSTDTAPSRIEHAKFLLRELVKAEPGNRFGMVAFAGTAYLLCPLTGDPVAFDQYVNELNVDSIPVGGTNLELALAVAARGFQAAEGANRAILLLTDGDELSGDSRRIVGELKKAHVPLLAVGLGDPAGAPVLDDKGAYRRDADGKVILSKLNEKSLQYLAQETGGLYVRSTASSPGLGVLKAKIRQLDAAVQSSGNRVIPVERFPLALAAAAILLLLYVLIPERSAARRNMLWLLAAFWALGAAGPQEKLPEDPAALYNLARDRQLEGKEQEAAALYESLLKMAPGRGDLQSKALFNLAGAAHSSARRISGSTLRMVQKQQLDPALKELENAGKLLQNAEELYSRALALPEGEAQKLEFGVNLSLLAADRRKVEELKKKIEELKKQQQQARNDTRKAQQQQQQQQKEKKEDRKKDKKDQQPNSRQDQQRDQQRGKNDDAMRQAQQSAEKLQQQAKDLKQDKLQDDARRAADELKQAREANRKADDKSTREHLRKAAEALGQPEKPKQPDPAKEKQEDGKKQPKDEKLPEQQAAAPQPAQPQQAKPDDNSKEELLRLLNNEENRRRRELNRNPGRRPPVSKDW